MTDRVGAGFGCAAWALLALAAAPAAASAQEKLAEFSSDRGQAGAGDSFGSAVHPLGDVDGDGVVDALIAASGEDDGSYPYDSHGFGAVYLVSGATGAVLRKHVGPEQGAHLGQQIAGGADFDGDGVPDYAIGVPTLPSDTEAGTVYVHSGASGALLHTWVGEQDASGFGSYLRIVGDVDGDGVEDLGIAAPEYALGPTKWGAGRAYVFSGRTGTPLRTFTGTQRDQRLATICGIGDVDADGRPDLLVGSYGWKAGPNGEGMIEVHSGASGALLYSRDGEVANDWFGARAAGLGDVNGDGSADFAVAAPLFDVTDTEGRVYVFSGPDGALLHTIDGGHANEQLGSLPAAGAIDFNADGFADVAIGTTYLAAPAEYESSVLVRSGRTGRLLFEIHGATYRGGSTESLGASLSVLGDLDGDGFGDLIAGAPGYSSTYWASEGRAYVFGGNDLLLQVEPPQPQVGDTVVLALRGSDPGLLGVIALTEVGGMPAFEALLVAPFDANGELELSAKAPPSAGGLDFKVIGYSQNRAGRGLPMDSLEVSVAVK